MSRTPEMVEALHPEGKSPTRVNKASYDAYRGAILDCLKPHPDGRTLADLEIDLLDAVPEQFHSPSGGCMWWLMTVKLDLEARGLVERVPGAKPQRLRLRLRRDA